MVKSQREAAQYQGLGAVHIGLLLESITLSFVLLGFHPLLSALVATANDGSFGSSWHERGSGFGVCVTVALHKIERKDVTSPNLQTLGHSKTGNPFQTLTFYPL